MFYIQFRDSFDKEKQLIDRKSIARFIDKTYIHFFNRLCPRRRGRCCLNLLRHGTNDSPSLIHRPSPEEAKKWATSFESVLKHKFGVQLFQDFLRSQYGEENLNFWLAVEEYKKADDNTRAEKARVIYEDYVSTLSPTEVSYSCVYTRVLLGSYSCVYIADPNFFRITP